MNTNYFNTNYFNTNYFNTNYFNSGIIYMSDIRQPYISWKGHATTASTTSWSRPLTNSTIITEPSAAIANMKGGQASRSTNRGSWTRTRPIKHWRKHLQPENTSGYSRSAISIQDQPGSNNVMEGNCCSETEPGNVLQIDISPIQSSTTPHTETLLGPNYSRICISCNNRIKPTAGLNTVPINSQNPSIVNGIPPTQRYNFDTKSYLRSRNKNFNSNINGNMKDDIVYSSISPNGCCVVPLPYTNDNNGPQVRSSMIVTDSNCSTNTCADVIVKPNNQKYFQQGGVSSSSRLNRLKYNTITSNANSFTTAWGASAASAGKYSENGNGPYFIKNKNNVCNPIKPLHCV